jgi:hypothetical protein
VLISEIKREAEAQPSGLCRYAEMLKDKFQPFVCLNIPLSLNSYSIVVTSVFCKVFKSRKLAICQVLHITMPLCQALFTEAYFLVLHWTDISWASFTYAAGWRKVTLKVKGAAASPPLLLHHPTCQRARSTPHHPAPTKILKAVSLNGELIRMSNKAAATKPRRSRAASLRSSIRSPTSTPRRPSIPSKAP